MQDQIEQLAGGLIAGKVALARTARRSFEFKASMEFVV
jgi:hypothetical protein